MSVPARLATMAAGLVLAFVLAFGVGRVTGGTAADGGARSQAGEVEVHDMGDGEVVDDPAGAPDHGDGPEPHGAGEGG